MSVFRHVHLKMLTMTEIMEIMINPPTTAQKLRVQTQPMKDRNANKMLKPERMTHAMIRSTAMSKMFPN